MELKLLVIRTGDIKLLSDFYSNFGLAFTYHKHGNSPFHYSASIGKMILEIYPLSKSQTKADDNLRLGFSINNFDSVIDQLFTLNTVFVTPPAQTKWGYQAVIQDPDGRKIELYKKMDSVL
jgi:lactoylglutathione lyase